MAKTIKITRSVLTGLPRSEKRRARAMNAVTVSAISQTVNGVNAGKDTGEGVHRHPNLADLNRVSIDRTNPTRLLVDGGDASVASSDISYELEPDSPTREDFISSKHDDTAKGAVTFEKQSKFLQGAKLGNGGEVNSVGEATFVSVTAQGFNGSLYDIGAFIAGISGGRLWMDAQGRVHLECDIVTVRDRLQARDIEVQEVTHVGGAQIISPAGGRCVDVQSIEGGWRCFFDAKKDGNFFSSQFRTGDRAFCQVFDVGNGGTHRWWRRVTAVGKDESAGRSYIDVSQSECEPGSDVPVAGDAVVCMGSDDPERANVIAMASYGAGAPLIVQLTGIDSYSITTDNIGTLISPNGNIFRGSFVATTGKNIEDIIKETDESIRLLVEGAGINLTDHTITIDADHLYFRDSYGRVSGMFTDGKFKAEFIDVANIIAQRLLAGAPDGQRVEIDPDSKSIYIADADGNVRTVISGDIYTTAAAVFGESTQGAFAADGKKRISLATPDANEYRPQPVTKRGTIADVSFHTDGATSVEFSGGVVMLTATACHTMKEAAGGAGINFPEGIKGHADVSVEILTYTDAAHTSLIHRTEVSKASVDVTSSENGLSVLDMKELDVTGTRVRLPRGGYHSLRVFASLEVCGNGSVAAADATGFAGVFVNDLTSSYYYANGWLIGSNVKNYASAYCDGLNRIYVEAESSGYGLKLTPTGIFTKHHDGEYVRMEELLYHAQVVVSGDALTAFGVKAMDAQRPALSKLDTGAYQLKFPQSWVALGLSNSQLRVCLTPLYAGVASASCFMMAQPTYVNIYTGINGAADDVSFLITITI